MTVHARPAVNCIIENVLLLSKTMLYNMSEKKNYLLPSKDVCNRNAALLTYSYAS